MERWLDDWVDGKTGYAFGQRIRILIGFLQFRLIAFNQKIAWPFAWYMPLKPIETGKMAAKKNHIRVKHIDNHLRGSANAVIQDLQNA